MGALEKFDTWSQRVLTANGLWSLIPAGAVVVITQRLAATASYLEVWGPFGWWMLALAAGIVSYLAISGGGLWLESRKLKRLQRKIAENALSPDLINPLANRFFQQRISLQHLSDPLGHTLVNKEFDRCQLIGPATVVIVCDYQRNEHANVEFVKIPDEKLSALPNKIILQGGFIRNCKVANVIFLVPESLSGTFEAGFGGNLTWMN